MTFAVAANEKGEKVLTMSKEYIERQRAIVDACNSLELYPSEYAKLEDALNRIPAADVAEVRHGRWEAWMPDKNGETREFICTGCRFMVEMSWKQKECDYEWCPYCGCKMDKEEPNERI